MFSACVHGFQPNSAEARYQLHVSRSTTDTALAWSVMITSFLLVLGARAIYDQGFHVSALLQLPLLHNGMSALLVPFILCQRHLFVEHRQLIWTACGVGRLLGHIMVVHGYPYTHTKPKAFVSAFVWPPAKFLEGTVEQLPLPLALAFAMAELFVLPLFLLAIDAESSWSAAVLRSCITVGLYLGGTMLKDAHSRHMWLCMRPAATVKGSGAYVKTPAVVGTARESAVVQRATPGSAVWQCSDSGNDQPAAAAAAAVAIAAVESGSAVVPASCGQQRKHGARYASGVPAMQRTSVSVKILDLGPADLPADAAHLIRQYLLAEDYLVTYLAIREACIEISIELLDLRARAASPQTYEQDSALQQCAKAMAEEKFLQLLSRLNLPFDGNQVRLQVGHEAPTASFRHDSTQQCFVGSQNDGSSIEDSAQPRRRAWTVVPVALKRAAHTGAVHLQICMHKETDSSPVQPSDLAARLGNEFLIMEVPRSGQEQDCTTSEASTEGITCTYTAVVVQVPADNVNRTLAHIDVRPGGADGPLCTGSCAVLLLEDAAVVAELCSQLQPMMLTAVQEGDLDQVQDLQLFMSDLGTWLEYVGVQSTCSPTDIGTHSGQKAQQQQQLMLATAQELLHFANVQGWSATAAIVAHGLAIIAPTAGQANAAEAPAGAALACADWSMASSPGPAVVDSDPAAGGQAVLAGAAAAASSQSTQHVAEVSKASASSSSRHSGTSSSSVRGTSAHDAASSSTVGDRAWNAPGARKRARAGGLPECAESPHAVHDRPAMVLSAISWSHVVCGFPDSALEARYRTFLHRLRGHYCMPLAFFAVACTLMEVRRCLLGGDRPFVSLNDPMLGNDTHTLEASSILPLLPVTTLSTLVPATPFMLWASSHIAATAVRARSPLAIEALAATLPPLLWAAQSLVPAWLICGLPHMKSFKVMTLSTWGCLHEVLHLGLPALFMRVHVPMATTFYTLTCILIIWMRIQLGSTLGIAGQVLQELPAWGVAVLFTSLADLASRRSMLAQEALVASALLARPAPAQHPLRPQQTGAKHHDD